MWLFQPSWCRQTNYGARILCQGLWQQGCPVTFISSGSGHYQKNSSGCRWLFSSRECKPLKNKKNWGQSGEAGISGSKLWQKGSNVHHHQIDQLERANRQSCPRAKLRTSWMKTLNSYPSWMLFPLENIYWDVSKEDKDKIDRGRGKIVHSFRTHRDWC